MMKTYQLYILLCLCATPSTAQTISKGNLSQDSILKGRSIDQVCVLAQKRIVKISADKIFYDVEGDDDAKSLTVLEILRKMPLVTVDGNDNIMINGSKSYKVLVDGQDIPMFTAYASRIFKGMPATMVKVIEVDVNPGAKYDAEGADVVMNLIMVGRDANAQMVDGFNGMLSTEAGLLSERLSAMISGNKGKLSFSANALANYGHNDFDIDIRRTAQDDSGMHTAQRNKDKIPLLIGNVNLGYNFNAQNILHVALGFTGMMTKVTGSPITSFYGVPYGDGLTYSSGMDTKWSSNNFNANISYQHFLNKDHTKELGLSYIFNIAPTKTVTDRKFVSITSPVNISGLNFDDTHLVNRAEFNEHTLKVDYSDQLSKNFRIEIGGKYAYRNQSANDSKYMNDIYIASGYLDGNITLEKVKGRVGLRYEHTWENMKYSLNSRTEYNKSYDNLVPSATLTYNITSTLNVGFNYKMNLTRPGITYLNPYVNTNTPGVAVYGNENLEVVKNHNLGLIFNKFGSKYMLNISFNLHYMKNGIEEYSFLKNNVYNTTFGNMLKNRTARLSYFMSFMISPKTTFVLSLSGSYVDLRSEQLNSRNNGWQGTAMTSLQQMLPWNLKMSFMAVGYAHQYTLEGDNGSMNMTSLALNKSFLKDRLSVGVRSTTTFSGKLKIRQRTNSIGFIKNAVTKVSLNDISITVGWKFGNTDRKYSSHQQQVEDSDFLEQKEQNQQLLNIGSNVVKDILKSKVD